VNILHFNLNQIQSEMSRLKHYKAIAESFQDYIALKVN
jgi:hypothetical protein